MGKFLAGCLIVLAVVVVAGGGAAYFFFIKPAADFAGDAVRFGQEFQRINEGVVNRSPHTPPRDGAVDEAQFERFLSAQREIRARLAARLDELDEKYSALKAQMDEEQREPTLRELARAYRDLGDLLLEAKRAQVEAINRYNFSIDEYVWVRNRVYQAIGESVAVAAIGDQPSPTWQPQVPQETVDMVAPHREELMETYALAWWGL